MFLVDVRLVTEAVGTVRGLREVTFMILTLVLKRDLGVKTKEGRKEMG